MEASTEALAHLTAQLREILSGEEYDRVIEALKPLKGKGLSIRDVMSIVTGVVETSGEVTVASIVAGKL